jgi:carbohydrate diacid regulator
MQNKEVFDMYLQQRTAARIIEEISKVLPYDINIMDETGAIIASTNPARIGAFHRAAYKIIHENLERLAVHRDGAYEGCLKGVNLPICFDNKLIGVIGITGDVSETSKYADILKKMTEVLASDIFRYHQNNLREQEKMLFFHDWLHDNIACDSAAFTDELKKYALSEERDFVVAVVRPRVADLRLPARGFVQTVIPDLTVVVGNAASAREMRKVMEYAIAPARAESRVVCAVGSKQADCAAVGKSYRHAMKALARSGDEVSGVILYEEMLKEIILDEVAVSQKKQHVDKVFGGVSPAERAECCDFILTYCRCNGSILRISKECFIHKNTVQYRINKMKAKTGLDLRVVEDMISLYLAAKWR